MSDDESTLDSRSLRDEAVAKAREIPPVSNIASFLDLALYIGVVAVAYFLLLRTDFHWAVCVLTFLVVSKSQNSLMLSGHEAMHYALYTNKAINNLVGAYCCFAPVGVGFYRARAAHLDHHRYLLSDRDEKLDAQLEHPTRKAFVIHLLRPLFGSYLWKGVCRMLGFHPNSRVTPQYSYPGKLRKLDLLSIGIMGVVLLVGLSLIDWRLFIFFWLGPLFTVTAFFHNAKSFLDHARLPDESEDTLYSYHVSWLDRLFFGVQQAHHAEHHLFPQIPYHRLDELEPLVDRMPDILYRKSYLSFLLKYYRHANSFPNPSA